MDLWTLHLGADAVTASLLRRCAASAAATLTVAVSAGIPGAAAIPAPTIDPTMVPADGPPGPDQAMRQSNLCATTIAVTEPKISQPSPGFAMLNIASAWRYSTGNGVPVAIIDTGVTPHRRLPVVPGGDYITGGDGLVDCDAHGTVVASVIAAAPQGIPMPRPMPPQPAFPSPVSTVSATPNRDAGPSRDPGPPDGLAGVAPHATIISIRQSSRAYAPQNPASGDGESGRKAGTVSTLARAVVHAVNLGARVINVGVAACVPAGNPMDQRVLGAAVWYAATVKDVVVVAPTGNQGEDGCRQNPTFDPLGRTDGRDWHHVATVSSPAWFADHVLSVGSVGVAGAFTGTSLAGPWIGVAAPAESVVGLSPADGSVVNAYPPARPGEPAIPFRGNSFATAYVSGVVALVRARFPNLSARQVIHRIQQTAHSPARGVDNEVGYGLVDPIAALTFDIQPGDRVAAPAAADVLAAPAVASPPDHRARTAAVSFVGAVAVFVLLGAVVGRARRAR